MEARRQLDDIFKMLREKWVTSAIPVKNLLTHENYFLSASALNRVKVEYFIIDTKAALSVCAKAQSWKYTR